MSGAGSDSTALLFSAKALVKFKANLVSNFDPEASCFGGMKLLLLFWGTQALSH
jgi:hypothetical protein